MRTNNALALAVATLLLASCVSVRNDSGIDAVERSLAQRGLGGVAWNATPSSANDPRVAAMLGGELRPEQAVAVALVNSPRLQVTLAELGIARAELIEASTIANPLLELELRYPGEPYHPYELRLAQTLVDLVQLPRRRTLGRAAFETAQLRVSAEVLRFAADVRSAWYDAVASEQQAALSRTTLAAAQAAAEVALKQHDAQNITDLDLENEQALYEQAKLDFARAGQRALLAREALVRAMGLRSGQGFALPGAFPELPAGELEQQQLEELAAAQRLDLAIAQRELDIARRRIPVARLAALGEIIADVHYERETEGEHTVGPGVEFPIPIFNTGRAARTRAEAQYLRAQHLVNALQAESTSQLRAARATLAEARARVEYYRGVVVPRRARIVELTKLEHNAMLVGVFQLLQAKQNHAQAERELIEAQRDYWSARTNLDRAVQGIASASSFEPATDQGDGKRADITRGGH